MRLKYFLVLKKHLAAGTLLTIAALSSGTACGAQSGGLDLTFDPGQGVDNQVYAIAAQNDGRIVIAGDFTTFNGLPQTNIVRLNTNGTRDVSFTAALGGLLPYANALVLEPNGKL